MTRRQGYIWTNYHLTCTPFSVPPTIWLLGHFCVCFGVRRSNIELWAFYSPNGRKITFPWFWVQFGCKYHGHHGNNWLNGRNPLFFRDGMDTIDTIARYRQVYPTTVGCRFESCRAHKNPPQVAFSLIVVRDRYFTIILIVFVHTQNKFWKFSLINEQIKTLRIFSGGLYISLDWCCY